MVPSEHKVSILLRRLPVLLALAAIACFAPGLRAQTTYAISGNNLISFDALNPADILNTTLLTGVGDAFQVEGLDFRPATRELYAFGYEQATGLAHLYVVNTTTAVATPVGDTATLDPNMGLIGFDFNPAVDRIRVTGSNGSNFRMHPETGAVVATDTDLAFDTLDVNAAFLPIIGTVAYTNSYLGSTATTLFNYDVELNVFTRQFPPNNGTLNTVGASGITVNPADQSVDLDIWYHADSGENLAYFAANTDSSTYDSLYLVNLTTGAVVAVGPIGDSLSVSNIAVSIDESCNIASISVGNFSACTGGNTSDTSDDTFTADVTVQFVNKPAGGKLYLGGDGVGDVDADSIGSLISYTFTGVTMTADSSEITLWAFFSADSTCIFSTDSAGIAPASCSPPCLVTIDSVLRQDLFCETDTDGSIEIFASGATGALQISFDGGTNFGTTTSVDSLAAGDYEIVVRDSADITCTANMTVTVSFQNALQTWFKDLDGDGYSDGVSVDSCLQPDGFYLETDLITTGGDCDDTDSTLTLSLTWYKDLDDDNLSDGVSLVACSQPAGYKLATELLSLDGDCDDNDATLGMPQIWYADLDGDGFSDGTNQFACLQPAGFVLADSLSATSGDCDDNDPAVGLPQTWYADLDGDGYSDGTSVDSCSQLAGFQLAADLIAISGDCDDNDATVVFLQTWYADLDGDGFSDGTSVDACHQPAGYKLAADLTATSGDCDDNDPAVGLPQTWYADLDGDGFSDGTSVDSCSQPAGYKLAADLTATTGDCDDNDPAVGLPQTWYADLDGDGFSDGTSQEACFAPGAGYYLAGQLIATSGDCNDNDPLQFPGQIWYEDVDGDGYSTGQTVESCSQPAGYQLEANLISIAGDCDDNDPNVFQAQTWYKDSDGDGYSDGTSQDACVQPAGYQLAADLTATSGDCDDNDALEFPGQTWYSDFDGDGYSDGAIASQCERPNGFRHESELIATSGDCDDTDADLNPGAAELCNGLDDNCNGLIDDNLVGTTFTGNVTFNSQAQVDAFDPCVSVIVGNLSIQNYNITDLSNLANLRKVTGHMTIKLSNLTSLEGLSNLDTVGGRLTINNNPNLTTLDGLEGLTSVGGYLRIYWNYKLKNCCAIYELINTPGAVQGSIGIYFNGVGCDNIETLNEECDNNKTPAPSAPDLFLDPGDEQPALTENEIRLTPNPANGIFRVFANASGEGTLRLLDLSGKVLQEQAVADASIEIEVNAEGLPAGLYLVQLKTVDSVLSAKISVQ